MPTPMTLSCTRRLFEGHNSGRNMENLLIYLLLISPNEEFWFNENVKSRLEAEFARPFTLWSGNLNGSHT